MFRLSNKERKHMSYSLESLKRQGLKHWKEFLPSKVQELKEAGTLDQELTAAAQMTLAEMVALREQGYTQHEAWSMARSNHLILPEEDGQEEELPDNLAWEAMCLKNQVIQGQEGEEG
jgi:hypothetical protein